jgi:hypothetical protein
MRYKIRKSNRTWKLYHFHAPNGGWHGPVMESSHWRNVAWVATGDPTHRVPNFILWPAICSGGNSTT